MTDDLFLENYLENNRPNRDIVHIIPEAVKLTMGWFFPMDWDGEPAVYMDYYIMSDGSVWLSLDQMGRIFEEALCWIPTEIPA